MKNKFLLLGATALLSTGLAMSVFADEPVTTTLKVNAAIVVRDVVIPIQDIDFGTFTLTPAQLEGDFSMTMNPANGVVTGDFPSLDGPDQKNGQVSLLSKDDAPKIISLPSEVYLRDYEKHVLKFSPNFVEINSQETGLAKNKTYGIGGTLQNAAYMGKYGTGVYSGEITVTVVADTGE